ncbi:MAG: hypothetical protein HOO93_10835 [Methyloglobulus sp.]|nr:hypothetical protein [Methyloglobulus sp.]
MRYFDDRSPFSKVVSMLFGLSLSVSSFADTAIPPKPLSDPALEAFLQKQIETEEGVQIQSVVKAELEPNLLGEERVVIWTLLGPAYWSNHLSVLSQPNGQWQLLATLSLGGAEATLEAVTSEGLISITAKTPGPDDPVCCPSQQQTLQYRYAKGQLVELKTESKIGKP